MKPINEIARALDSAEYPGVRQHFRLPKAGGYEGLISRARAFVEALPSVKILFTDRGMAPGFDTELTAKIDDLIAATATKYHGLADRMGGTAGLAANPFLLAGWKGACHVERGPIRKASPVPAAAAALAENEPPSAAVAAADFLEQKQPDSRRTAQRLPAMHLKTLLTPLAAALALATTTGTSFADHKVTVYRDNDHDGHYNKTTYDTGHHNYYYGGHRGYYGGNYGYYGRGYGYGYGSRYGYGYQPYYYGYPRVGVSVYSSPSYYRGYSSGDGLSADVQSALRHKGYYGGPIDGDIGSGSRSAIRSYQRDHGLAVTGRIDSSLLRSLGIR